MDIKRKIVYEDNHIIVVNKDISDLVQGDKTGDISLDQAVKLYLKKKYNKPGNVFLGVVHRLDRPVSGLVIFARTSKSLSRLNRMFQEKEIKKTYWAVVADKPPKSKGTLKNYLLRKPEKNKSFVYDREVKGSKFSILHYNYKGKSDSYYLLEVDLETGRHHQIRAQLSHIGCPIKGDLKYGAGRSNKNGGIHLHARCIEFVHPVTREKLQIVAHPPKDPVWDYFSRSFR